MAVVIVLVDPCVLAPFPFKERACDLAVKDDVANALSSIRLCKEANLIRKIWHEVRFSFTRQISIDIDGTYPAANIWIMI
jgi:hypothetical protein